MGLLFLLSSLAHVGIIVLSNSIFNACSLQDFVSPSPLCNSVVQNIIERYFKINLSKWWTAKQIKKRKLKRIWDLVRWNNDCDVFVMGHTHNPEVLIWVDKYENIKTYVNTGDWVDNCTYVIIKDGQIRLRKWESK